MGMRTDWNSLDFTLEHLSTSRTKNAMVPISSWLEIFRTQMTYSLQVCNLWKQLPFLLKCDTSHVNVDDGKRWVRIRVSPNVVEVESIEGLLRHLLFTPLYVTRARFKNWSLVGIGIGNWDGRMDGWMDNGWTKEDVLRDWWQVL